MAEQQRGGSIRVAAVADALAGAGEAGDGSVLQRDLLEQVDVSAAWPISRKWRGFARWVYSIDEQKTLDQFVGVEYSSCCWAIRAAAGTKRVALELGGNAGVIVDETADLKMAARTLMWGKYTNCGQTCIAPDYALVKEGLEREFADVFTSTVRRTYPTLGTNTQYTAIVNDRHVARLQGLLDDAKAKALLAESRSVLRPSLFVVEAERCASAGVALPLLGSTAPKTQASR